MDINNFFTYVSVAYIYFFLTKIGFINLASLRSNRRFIIVIFFILAAILSPPDPISQLMIAIPLLLLYEFSIFILKIFK